MKRIYTEAQLNQLCKEYQKLLRLQDWNVEVKLVDQFTIPENEGIITRHLSTKQACISIPSPETFASAVSAEQDMLYCLLHELIHLHFPGAIEKRFEEMEHDLFELGINCLAWAIADLVPLPDFDVEQAPELYECWECYQKFPKNKVLRGIRPNSGYIRCLKCAEKFDTDAREAVKISETEGDNTSCR